MRLSACVHPLLKSRRPEGGCQTAAGTLQNRRLCLLLFTPLKVIHFLCNKSKNTEVCKEFLHLFQTKLNSTRWPSSNPAFFLHCFPAQANCDKEIHRHSCFFFFFKVVKAFLFTFDHRMLLPWEFQGSSSHTVLGNQRNGPRKAGLGGLSAPAPPRKPPPPSF